MVSRVDIKKNSTLPKYAPLVPTPLRCRDGAQAVSSSRSRDLTVKGRFASTRANTTIIKTIAANNKTKNCTNASSEVSDSDL